jgi:rhamnulokinase
LAGVPAHLRWLNLPEYMLYRWGARPVAELTNATHTALVALEGQGWSGEIFSAAGLDPSAAPEIVPSGTVVGRLQGPLGDLPALRDTLLIAPACHDTASAIAGIPAAGEDWAYISSGTWSLVGTLLDRPCAGPGAAQWDFTNLGAVGGKFCFHRIVNGLWLLEQCMESWRKQGEAWDLQTLLNAASQMPPPGVLLDVDAPEMVLPGEMPEKIAAQWAQQTGGGDKPALSAPAIANLILHGLAARYATVLDQARQLTGRQFARLYVVGGGSKNLLLNKLTQQAAGISVFRGPAESATLGNFAVQLASLEQGDAQPHGVSHDAVFRWAEVLGRSQTAHALPNVEQSPKEEKP